MTDIHYTLLGSLLIDIECELRRAGFWDTDPPSAEALASMEPFAVDTLDFHQWLQFIFLPRMCALVDTRAPLPEKSAIAAMAETVWANNAAATAVIRTIRQFDALISPPDERLLD